MPKVYINERCAQMQMVSANKSIKRVDFLGRKINQYCTDRESLREEQIELLSRLDTIKSRLLSLDDKIPSLNSAQMAIINTWR